MHLQYSSNGPSSDQRTSNMNDIVIKSSSDIHALTYCDLKCINIHGLVDVLKLYPEYQQQFANDIQHDLTFNVREGYEAEAESEGNGIPTLTLPSISEDDENANEEGETSPLSPNRSPLHALSISPRHAKLNLRLQEFQESIRKPRMGGIATNHLALLRQRVERQRSVNTPHHSSKTGSMEEISSELKSDVENTRIGVDSLDLEISTLHQDVATLSAEVRNAIQALQEMATPSTCNASIISYSAQSNPNIAHFHRSPSGNGMLARSNSHPPEMFCWEGPPSPPFVPIRTYVDSETQTESIVAIIRQYINEQPRQVLEMLGLDPDKISTNLLEIRKSRSIPDYNSGLKYVGDFSDLSDNIISQANVCLVNLQSDVNNQTRGESPYVWNAGATKIQIFESLKCDKSQNALFRNNDD